MATEKMPSLKVSNRTRGYMGPSPRRRAARLPSLEAHNGPRTMQNIGCKSHAPSVEWQGAGSHHEPVDEPLAV